MRTLPNGIYDGKWSGETIEVTHEGVVFFMDAGGVDIDKVDYPCRVEVDGKTAQVQLLTKATHLFSESLTEGKKWVEPAVRDPRRMDFRREKPTPVPALTTSELLPREIPHEPDPYPQ